MTIYKKVTAITFKQVDTVLTPAPYYVAKFRRADLQLLLNNNSGNLNDLVVTFATTGITSADDFYMNLSFVDAQDKPSAIVTESVRSVGNLPCPPYCHTGG